MESKIRLKGLCFIRKVCFLHLCKDWKISRLKRDNALQNCEYINIVHILESFFVASVFVITDIGDPQVYFLLFLCVCKRKLAE